MPMQDFLLFWAKAHTAPNAVVSPWHAQIAAQTNICAVTDSSMVSVEKIHIERERTRKRPRLAWDVAPPSASEAQRALPVPGDEGFERKHVSPPKRDDDREGHYVFNLGENLTPRYKILGKMGEGTFGRVLECWDRQTREYVAIKVVRSIRKYRDAAMLEIDVLQQLAKNDRGSSRCVQIRNWFDYRNHICIGEALFQTHENLEHLAMMERVLGPIPEHMICRSNKGAEKYFKRGSRLRWPEGAVSRESISAVKKLGHLKDIVSRNVDSSRSSLTELLHGLLTYDPTKRITARQALDHPFFRNPT
ncbi:Serine/threonine-protein kinase AFC3 [Glycine max]|nr:Serine/threonine-protein kinase AFC3 [Glycine max]